VVARVIRFQPGDPTHATPQQCGVLFVDVSKVVRRALTVYIWQRLRDAYPDEITALFPGSRNHRRKRKGETHTAKPQSRPVS
jgi:hypothetical protein